MTKKVATPKKVTPASNALVPNKPSFTTLQDVMNTLDSDKVLVMVAAWSRRIVATPHMPEGHEDVLLFKTPREDGTKGWDFILATQRPDGTMLTKYYRSKKDAVDYLISKRYVEKKLSSVNPNFDNFDIAEERKMYAAPKQPRGGPVVTTKLITVNAE